MSIYLSWIIVSGTPGSSSRIWTRCSILQLWVWVKSFDVTALHCPIINNYGVSEIWTFIVLEQILNQRLKIINFFSVSFCINILILYTWNSKSLFEIMMNGLLHLLNLGSKGFRLLQKGPPDGFCFMTLKMFS